MKRATHQVMAITPFEHPDFALAAALERAGALAAIDLGHRQADCANALARLAARASTGIGVRIPEACPVALADLPANVRWLVAPIGVLVAEAARSPSALADREVFAQLTSADELALARGLPLSGLIVKGAESSGRVGDETSFVLLQRILSCTDLPVWVQGGIGLHTAAACIAGGAQGVVVDSQMALLEEASTSPALRRVLAGLDGSETCVLHGYRVLTRPDTAPIADLADQPTLIAQLGADEPREQLVTLGQDVALAPSVAQRFGSVRRWIRGLERAAAGHLRQARRINALAHGSPLAAELGLPLPIFQGPMTRVSDVPAFAGAVARAGGLPFTALALMHGSEASALLHATAVQCAGLPWGVGMLGFVPAELRDAQLAAVLEAKPRAVIIAGGRPSQARQLEAAGIATFLHVPSPGLLDAFLKDGATRFVFEGRECGGHVGPRTSFLLWEGAVERLLQCENPEGITAIFAGGIHDARSAAMVATLTAPLSARGVRVGVLMGTAYLFTHEAVDSGAIAPTFQREALRCSSTALVETAPGHATRCAVTPFVETFHAERARLVAEGADAQRVWAELEQLNLGRLRIATKGLRRVGEHKESLDAEAQYAEGMYMIGQVAALRSACLGMAELHREVTAGASAWLARCGEPEPPPSRAPLDIAIVGAACLFPDAPDLEAYWSNVVRSRNSVRDVPRDRWDPEVHYDPQGAGEKTPSRWGAFLGQTVFEPTAYGIPPRSLAAIDPTQLLALHVARCALDDARLGDSFERERAGVVFGAEAGSDLSSAFSFRASLGRYLDGPLPVELEELLPKLTEDSFAGVLANVIAGRIANRLDLRGPNYAVDAACASSLAALHNACKELMAGDADVMIAGGVDLHNGLHDYLMFASAHALSPTGQCRAFDAKADGTTLGEGVAAVVLKRLADAERDGDHIYAVIRAIGSSSDGKALGLTAPRVEGQVRALERAYAAAGISPAAVGLVEAHGTGTVVGDRIEISALTEVFEDSGAPPLACTLGSVKSMIGHTKCAAGMAGLIKAMLAVERGVLPPTLNVTSPNPGYRRNGPFVMRDSAAPWQAPRRIAGVSAFGFGGTNFHAVITNHRPGPAQPIPPRDFPIELFALRAPAADGLAQTVDALAKTLESLPPPRLCDLAAASERFAADAPIQCMFTAESLDEVRAKLALVRQGKSELGVVYAASAAGSAPPKIAFLFSGQGSQTPGMFADLFVAFPALRSALNGGDAYLDRLYPGSAYTPSERGTQLKRLTDTSVAQPSLGMAELALTSMLGALNVRPSFVAGHSYGELVALWAAGAIDADALMTLSEARARAIADATLATPGTMAAVRAPVEKVQNALADVPDVVIANHNAPDQVVIAGPVEAVGVAVEACTEAGLTARTIPVSCAFHSPLVADASRTFARSLEDAAIAAPRVPVFANSTAGRYPADPQAVRELLAAQLARPVRFVEQLEAMHAAGAELFLEVGPGSVLTDLVARTLRDRPHWARSAAATPQRSLESLMDTLLRLFERGVPVEPRALFEGRARPLTLGEAVQPSATAWLIDGGSARPWQGPLPDFAMKPLKKRVALAAATPHLEPQADRDATVREFLRASREVVEAQRDVMLQLLGADVATAPRRAKPEPVPARVTASETLATAPAVVAVTTVVESPAEALLSIVAQRTGYPAEMLDADLDLEADLGIDSIKRLEIVAALRERSGIAIHVEQAAQDALIERLAKAKTLRAIGQLLAEMQEGERPGGPARADGAAQAGPALALPAPDASASAPAERLERFVVDVEVIEPPVRDDTQLRGKRFAVISDTESVAAALAQQLAALGADVVAKDQPADGLVFMWLGGGEPDSVVPELFARVKDALDGKVHWITAVTGLGGKLGHHAHAARESFGQAGVGGLFKCVAKEHPGAHVRVIDLDPEEPASALAAYIIAELTAADRLLEVGYAAGVRSAPQLARRPSSVPPAAPRVSIDASSVVLITGGARGITAQVAVEMARRFKCTIELVGRTRLDQAESDPELASALDHNALRRLLIGRMNGAGRTSPAAIEAQCKQLLAEREVRATMDAIRAAGGKVDYHAVDVSDPAAFRELLLALRDRHGRIHGVIHGAGRVEDKLLSDKTAESFLRVFRPKVIGARTLLDVLAPELDFLVFFSSVSSTFGNRGQSDYAAANDVLDKLAHFLHTNGQSRVLSINWGPWRGIGMVQPELEREYDRRGIGLISPSAGVDQFFEELLEGEEPQAILTAGSFTSFDGVVV